MLPRQDHSPLKSKSLPPPSACCFSRECSGHLQSWKGCTFCFCLQYREAALKRWSKLCQCGCARPGMNKLPGVLPGVLDEMIEEFPHFPGDNPLWVEELEELVFLCHRAIGPFEIGTSSFRVLWMSFSNPKWAIWIQLAS